ncbi:MAG: DNA polymerase [Candidatus Parcubacteria bacterium]|nr:MAG: DNA polymerase [Candidatus Parcubacteria bacterium]
MDKQKKEELLKQIRDEVLNLKSSPLYSYRVANNYYPVIGQGNHDAKIMFIGEAPGRNEAESGIPFCGAAGKILDELLASIGLPRSEVYITNILKDRPPENRDPLPEEIKVYAPFLDRQIEIIQPQVIVTLGRFSTAYILEKFGLKNEIKPISQIKGKVFSANPLLGHAVKIIPLYHPAVAVYNNNVKEELKKDFQVIKQFL